MDRESVTTARALKRRKWFSLFILCPFSLALAVRVHRSCVINISSVFCHYIALPAPNEEQQMETFAKCWCSCWHREQIFVKMSQLCFSRWTFLSIKCSIQQRQHISSSNEISNRGIYLCQFFLPSSHFSSWLMIVFFFKLLKAISRSTQTESMICVYK